MEKWAAAALGLYSYDNPDTETTTVFIAGKPVDSDQVKDFLLPCYETLAHKRTEELRAAVKRYHAWCSDMTEKEYKKTVIVWESACHKLQWENRRKRMEDVRSLCSCQDTALWYILPWDEINGKLGELLRLNRIREENKWKAMQVVK